MYRNDRDCGDMQKARGQVNRMDDMISRQAAIDAIMGEPTDAHYPSWYAERLEQLPSAQPEIIYCKDCKWKQGAECVRFADVRPFPSDFCSRAERRSNE